MSSGYSGGSFAYTGPSYQELLYDAQIKYPASNYLGLEGEIPARNISELLQEQINFFQNRSGNKAEIDLFKTRTDQYKEQKTVIDTKIKQEDLKLKQQNVFLKELKDFSSINFANIQADQARIEGNYKKYLGLGILGAALLG